MQRVKLTPFSSEHQKWIWNINSRGRENGLIMTLILTFTIVQQQGQLLFIGAKQLHYYVFLRTKMLMECIKLFIIAKQLHTIYTYTHSDTRYIFFWEPKSLLNIKSRGRENILIMTLIQLLLLYNRASTRTRWS